MPKTSKTAFMSNKRAIKLFFLQLHLWLITSDTFEKIWNIFIFLKNVYPEPLLTVFEGEWNP